MKIHTFPHTQAEQGKIERDKHRVQFIYLVVNESQCHGEEQHGPWIVFQIGEVVFRVELEEKSWFETMCLKK